MATIRIVTRPDLLERFSRLGVSAVDFCVANGLPRSFIQGMRAGKYASDVSTNGYMPKLEEAIAAAEHGVFGNASIPVIGNAVPRGPHGTVDSDADEETVNKRLMELGAACEAARTARELSELGSKIAGMGARKEIPIALMKALHENISRREQLLADERLEEEQARAGEETIVRVIYVNNWTGGPLPA